MIKWLKYVTGVLLLILVLFVYKGWAPDIPHDQLAAKYATGASEFVTLPSGARAHYRMQGNRDGKTMLLLHGSNSSLHTWESWVESLSDDFFTVTIDLPGHGLTGPVPDEDYTYKGMVRFLKEFNESLGLKSFVLGGNSMGGGVTLSYALTYPGDVTHLILVDASGVRLPASTSGKVDRPLAFELAGRWYANWILENITPRSLARDGLMKSVSRTEIVTEDMIDRYWELVRHPGNRSATAKRFSSYREMGGLDLPVDRITAPTLIIWGQEDTLIPVETADVLTAKIPNAQLRIFEGVGHLPMEEIAAETASEVRNFLLAH